MAASQRLTFEKAERRGVKLRMAIAGPSGSGKTYSALRIAKGIVGSGGRIAVIDTEHESARKYADKFDFSVVELSPPFHPERYMEAIAVAIREGFDLLVIDSLSHAWAGSGGLLDLVNDETARSRSGNAFSTGWRKYSPVQHRLIEAIVHAPVHVIVTMRSKQDYLIGKDEKGKSTIEKVGLAPVQRADMEYEFDMTGWMGLDHRLVIDKTRFDEFDNAIVEKPGEDFGEMLSVCLDKGGPAPARPAAANPPPTPATDAEGETPDNAAPPTLGDLGSLRKAAGVSSLELKSQVMESYGNVEARDLSPDQIAALCDWIKAKMNDQEED